MVEPLTGSQLVLETEDDMAIRFAVSEISEMKKASAGVRGMQLAEGDHVKNAFQVSPRAKSSEESPDWSRLRLSKRGGKGSRRKKG